MGKRVLVFGNTGFTGSWLSLWLERRGAEVLGFSLPPEDRPNLFEAAGLQRRIETQFGDVRDAAAVHRAVEAYQPEIVFHLAAQSRVRRSYRVPLQTLATNVMGTAHVLEALGHAGGVKSCVVVTSDKCYENGERDYAYREEDPLGGSDPYAASKACAELVVSCYRRAFLEKRNVLVASARAGNIIGGGDWAEDRIVPDCVRAIEVMQPLTLRKPDAVRPWQHVLDALFGYLLLAEGLSQGHREYAQAWNFGPIATKPRTVIELINTFIKAWGCEVPAPILTNGGHHGPREAGQLRLDPTKAIAKLNWKPRLAFDEAVEWTADWYRRFARDRTSALGSTLEQIDLYEARLEESHER